MGRASDGLKVPVADNDGELLWVDDAIGLDEVPGGLTCVGCAAPLVWRHGDHKRPHFAHTAHNGCGSETALHRIAIEVISHAIIESSASGTRFQLEVPCDGCRTVKAGNLAKHKGLTIDRDRVLADRIRPDILLRDSSGMPLVAIEVIVSHAPEPASLALYERLGLPLVSVWPRWDDLEQLREGFPVNRHVTPIALAFTGYAGLYDVANYRCSSPRHFHETEPVECTLCASETISFAVEVATAQCYKCRAPARILDLVQRIPAGLRIIAASCSTLSGVEPVAKRFGVGLRDTYSATAGRTYLAHHCPRGHMLGDNYIYDSEGALDATRSVQHMTVCANGHWLDDGGPRRWPSDVRARRVKHAVGLAGGTVGLFDSSRVSPLEQLVVDSSGPDQWTPPMDPDDVLRLTARSLANAAAVRAGDESLDALYALDHAETEDAQMRVGRLCIDAADRHGIDMEALAAGVREFLTGGWNCSQFYDGAFDAATNRTLQILRLMAGYQTGRPVKLRVTGGPRVASQTLYLTAIGLVASMSRLLDRTIDSTVDEVLAPLDHPKR